MEVLPITEITFPNVTVCPPRKTFTALNYDLMKVKGVQVDQRIRDHISSHRI